MSVVTITAALRPSSLAAALSITVTGAVAGETMTVVRRVGTTATSPVMGASAIQATGLRFSRPSSVFA